MRRTFIIVYKPYKDREQELLPAVRASYIDLRKGGYVTSASPMVMKAKDDSIILIFEWKNEQMKHDAQTDPVIQKHWMLISKLCEFARPMNLIEFQEPFSEFETIEWTD
jgi:hypothetical protein